MTPSIPMEIQAAAASIEAANYRGAVRRHEEMAQAKPRPKWNAELLPMERTRADELDAVAATMRALNASPRAQAVLAAERREKAA